MLSELEAVLHDNLVVASNLIRCLFFMSTSTRGLSCVLPLAAGGGGMILHGVSLPLPLL